MTSEKKIGKFEWNPKENKQNIRKLGIDFNQVEPLFDWWHFTEVDVRHRGDFRERTYGRLSNGKLVCVVHSPRGDVTRIISVRKQTKQELQRYYGKLERALG